MCGTRPLNHTLSPAARGHGIPVAAPVAPKKATCTDSDCSCHNDSHYFKARDSRSTVLRADSLEALKGFGKRSDQLGIWERGTPAGAEVFFQQLRTIPELLVKGKVHVRSADADIRALLEGAIPEEFRAQAFYEVWLADMARLCEAFCYIHGVEEASFWLGARRSCVRYHTDNVPMRMLVTYDGKGTEWLPDEAADRTAYRRGKPNQFILRDKSMRQFLGRYDVAVFRGGPRGVLHRTPDEALRSCSLLMRLDAGFD